MPPTTATTQRWTLDRPEQGGAEADARGRMADLSLRLHSSLEVERIAQEAANEGRLLLGCDRVCVLIEQAGRMRVAAVSGCDRVSQRSDAARAMTALAGAVAATGEAVHSDASSLPADLENLLDDHTAASGAVRVEVAPLRIRAEPALADEPTDPPPAFGAVIFEQYDPEASPLDPLGTQEFLAHAGSALQNAISHQHISRWSLRRGGIPNSHANPLRRRPLTWACGAVLLVVAIGSIPLPLRVESPGVLAPVARRMVFAPTDAQVEKTLVEGGEQVTAGQPLARLVSLPLQTELLSSHNQLRESQAELASLEAERGDRTLQPSPQREARLHGRIAQARIEIDGLRQHVASLEQQLASLTIRSPINGTVATLQTEQRLRDRPVRRGDALLEVMDTSGEWRLELDVPAERVGRLRNASTDAPPVNFVLTTQPETSYVGQLSRLDSRVTQSADGSQRLRAQVAFDQAAMPERLAGAGVLARIKCGRAPLAYVLLGDIYDFARRRFWW